MYEKKKNTPKAIEFYQKAIAVDIHNILAYHNLGYIYFLDKQYDKAIAQYDLALKYHPKYLKALRNRAYANKAKGEFSVACEDIKKAIALGDIKATELESVFCKGN